MITYTPQVDDYVKWKEFTGWVYFLCDDYITIEISVKDKCEENIRDCPIHKKTHCLLLCYKENWKDLTYIKHRRPDGLSASASDGIDVYKSQEHRDSDLYG